ncbi:MAG TPA: hypothetical protein VMU22_11020 [Rhizomicrobium sp.]|nr:hypothetical protein [Rhizomicrobium sp.]
MKKTPTAKAKAPPKSKRSAKPKTKAASGLTAAQFRKIALSFPGTREGTSYGMPSILLLDKFFTRLRKEDNSAVLHVDSIDERDMLIEAEPRTFHITDHYKNYPDVLARLEKLDAATLRSLLERRWRAMVPKKMLKELDGQ